MLANHLYKKTLISFLTSVYSFLYLVSLKQNSSDQIKVVVPSRVQLAHLTLKHVFNIISKLNNET